MQPGNVFATAHVDDGRQHLAFVEPHDAGEHWRVSVYSYDADVGEHMRASFDFETSAMAWHFFNEYKAKPDVRAQVVSAMTKSFTELKRKMK